MTAASRRDFLFGGAALACAAVPLKAGECLRLTPQEAMQLYSLLYKLIDGYKA